MRSFCHWWLGSLLGVWLFHAISVHPFFLCLFNCCFAFVFVMCCVLCCCLHLCWLCARACVLYVCGFLPLPRVKHVDKIVWTDVR